MSASAIQFPRTGPAIRAVLAEHAPDDLVDFEREFITALAETEGDFDLTRLEDVINRWWGKAHLRVLPQTPQERAAVTHAAAGCETGLYTRDSSGTWIAN